MVSLGTPNEEELDEFVLNDIENIKVYVQNNIQANNDTLNIKLLKFLFKESLIVEGIIL